MKLKQFVAKWSLKPTKELKTITSLIDASTVTLPDDACLHHPNTDISLLGLDPYHPLLLSFKRNVRLYHESDLQIVEGKGLKRQVQRASLIGAYFKGNRRLKKTTNITKDIADQRSLLVYDYSLLAHEVTYSTHIRNPIFEWFNLRLSVNKGITAAAENRHNIVLIEMPQNIPEKIDFKKASENISNEQIGAWSEYASHELLDLWRYADGKGQYAELSEMTQESITIALHDRGKVIFVPLTKFRPKGEDDSPQLLRTHFMGLLELFRANRSVVDKIEMEELTGVADKTDKERMVTERIDSVMESLVRTGIVSDKERQAFVRLAERTAELPDPFGDPSKTMVEAAKVAEEDKVLTDDIPTSIKNIPNKGVLKSSVKNMDKEYVEKLLKKDVINTVLKMHDAGVVVTGVEVEEKIDAQNHYDEYTVKVTPVHGRKSTIRFQIPKIDEDGIFLSGGNRYTMDTQKVDAPIRKTGPGSVALTSYYGKIFIKRSPNMSDNYGRWLTKKISAAFMDSENDKVRDLKYNTLPKLDVPLPVAYTALAEVYSSFKSEGLLFNFDYNNRFEVLGHKEKDVKDIESKGMVLVGTAKVDPIFMDAMGNLTQLRGKELLELGRLETLLEFTGNVPRDFAVMNIFRKRIPVILVLTYLLGFQKTVKMLGVKYRSVPTGTRIEKRPNDIIIKFKDETLIVDGTDPKISMAMAGFHPIRKSLVNYSIRQLESPASYVGLLEPLKIQSHALRELELQHDMFIDPITEGVLKDMDEPTSFKPLLVRSMELLTTDQHPDETQTDQQRFRALERIPGMIYNRLIEGLRVHKQTASLKSAVVDVNPRSVLLDLVSDQSVLLAERINPIHALKEMEAVNVGGQGGRSAETMVRGSRMFHPQDLGVISEASPDSGKVGLRTFFSGDPNIKNLRGQTTRYEKGQSATKVLSTTAMLSPCSNHDDGKRVVLLNVQMSAMVGSPGYQTMPLRTPTDLTIGSRAPNEFAYSIPDDGVVKKVEEDLMTVELVDGTKVAVELGTSHGDAAGVVYPHLIVTDLTEGDKVKAGDVVAWNADFFERDVFNPGNVAFKMGAPARTVFMEGNSTFEDGSAISSRFASKLSTRNSKVKTIVVDINKEVLNLVKLQDTVDLDSPLCVIQDAGLNDIVDSEDVLAGLANYGRDVPRAEFSGLVSKIEFYWLGNREDMSESLEKLAAADSKDRVKQGKRRNKKVAATGELSQPTFVGGEKIERDQCAIVIYMDQMLPAVPGDKLVVGPQLKTIPGTLLDDRTRTESGDSIDLRFGRRSMEARIVVAAETIGIVNTAHTELAYQAAKIYFDEN